MADIIQFDRARSRPSADTTSSIQKSRFAPTRPEGIRETPRQRAGRKRNPLRQDVERISLAVTIAGKIANGRTDELEGWGDYVAMLRRGADSARFLAEALDSVFNEPKSVS